MDKEKRILGGTKMRGLFIFLKELCTEVLFGPYDILGWVIYRSEEQIRLSKERIEIIKSHRKETLEIINGNPDSTASETAEKILSDLDSLEDDCNENIKRYEEILKKIGYS